MKHICNKKNSLINKREHKVGDAHFVVFSVDEIEFIAGIQNLFNSVLDGLIRSSVIIYMKFLPTYDHIFFMHMTFVVLFVRFLSSLQITIVNPLLLLTPYTTTYS
jgi:hypothetical protein